MVVITEAEVAAIRAAFDHGGELSAAAEVLLPSDAVTAGWDTLRGNRSMCGLFAPAPQRFIQCLQLDRWRRGLLT